jgi:hypothetical protein
MNLHFGHAGSTLGNAAPHAGHDLSAHNPVFVAVDTQRGCNARRECSPRRTEEEVKARNIVM